MYEWQIKNVNNEETLVTVLRFITWHTQYKSLYRFYRFNCPFQFLSRQHLKLNTSSCVLCLLSQSTTLPLAFQHLSTFIFPNLFNFMFCLVLKLWSTTYLLKTWCQPKSLLLKDCFSTLLSSLYCQITQTHYWGSQCFSSHKLSLFMAERRRAYILVIWRKED